MRYARTLALGLVVLVAGVPVDSAAERRALLIGIESYGALGDSWDDLGGPRNDVELVRRVLTERHAFPSGNVRVLLDHEATGAGMRDAFETLIGSTQPGDVVLIHYSGHGSRVRDTNRDEKIQQKDATLVPIDAHGENAFEILDDEIAIWIDRLRRRSAHVTLVVDACHSGSISRSGTTLRSRGAPIADQRDYSWSQDLIGPLAEIETDPSPRGTFVRVSACQDNQLAFEHKADDGTVYGLFTWNWVRALNAAQPGDTYRDLFANAQAWTEFDSRRAQTPFYEESRPLTPFGEAVAPAHVRIVVAETLGDTVRVHGGLLSGVTPGATFGSIDGPATSLRILQASAFEATALVLDGSDPESGVPLQLTRPGYAFSPLEVGVVASQGAGDLERAARSALEAMGGIRLVDGVPDLTLALAPIDEGGYLVELLDPAGAPFGERRFKPEASSLTVKRADDLSGLIRHMEIVLRNRSLLQCAQSLSQGDPGVRFEAGQLTLAAPDTPSSELFRKGPFRWARTLSPDRNGVLTVSSRDSIGFRLVNDSMSGWYVYLLNVTPSGAIQVLYPPAGDQIHINATRSGDLTAVTLGEEVGHLDSYLCFLSETSGQFGRWETDGFCDPPTRSTTEGLTLERLENALNPPATRGADLPRLAVRTLIVDVEPPP